MKAQFQKTKESGCVSACIATLLEMKIESVPDFSLAAEVEGVPYPAFWLALQSWLSERGLWMLEVKLPPNMPWQPIPFAALCIFFGETEKGVKHAIVGKVEGADFIPVFNPWPEAEIQGISGLGFILPRDPHLPVRMGVALERIQKFADGMPGLRLAQEINNEASQALGFPISGVGMNGSRIIVPR